MGYVETTQAIIALQQGDFLKEKTNKIVEYKYDSVKKTISYFADAALADNYPAKGSTFAVRDGYVLIGRPVTDGSLSFLGCLKPSNSMSLACSDFTAMNMMTSLAGSVGIALTSSQNKIYAIANPTPNSLARMDIDAVKKSISSISIPPVLPGPLITLFDIDQDQHADLLYVDPSGTKISVYKNDKNNNFAAASDENLTARLAQKLQRLKLDTTPIKTLRVGDIDGSGSDDLIVVQDKTISFLQVFADDCMQLAANSINTPSPAIAVAVGDLDGKDARDIIVMSGGEVNQISVYLGKLTP